MKVLNALVATALWLTIFALLVARDAMAAGVIR